MGIVELILAGADVYAPLPSGANVGAGGGPGAKSGHHAALIRKMRTEKRAWVHVYWSESRGSGVGFSMSGRALSTIRSWSTACDGRADFVWS